MGYSLAVPTTKANNNLRQRRTYNACPCYGGKELLWLAVGKQWLHLASKIALVCPINTALVCPSNTLALLRLHTVTKAHLNKLVFISICIQAALTFTVVGFSAYQVSRCSVDKEDCPRSAIFINLISTLVAYWFPSPVTAYLAGSSSTTSTRSSKRSNGNLEQEAAFKEEEAHL